MTERALLVKSCTSADGRYYAVGLGSPHVRVFDTTKGQLCAHIDLAEKMAIDKRAGLQSVLNTSASSTYHDRAQQLAATRDITLTAVHITSPSTTAICAGTLASGMAGDVEEMGQICIAGFSNGTVIAVRLVDDTVVYHVAVSDTQQPVIAFASTSEYIFALCANKQLHIIDCASGARRVLGIPTPANTTAIAVYAASAGSSVEAGRVDVLLCGTSTLYCSLHVPTHRSYQKMDNRLPNDLGGSSTPTTHAFIGSTLCKGAGATNIAITCAASEGVVRVWDLSLHQSLGGLAATGAGAGGRCRRILPCHHRVSSMSVRPENGVITVTTIAGQILIWEFVTADGCVHTNDVPAIIAKAGDAYAQPATVAISSTSVPLAGGHRSHQQHRGVVRGVPTRKILDACLVSNATQSESRLEAAASCSLVIVRGKYALPTFDGVSLKPVFTTSLISINRDAAEGQTQMGGTEPEHRLYLTAPGVTVSHSSLGPNLSFNPHEGVVTTTTSNLSVKTDEVDEDDDEEVAAAMAQFELKLGAGWATHSAASHRAMVTAAEEFSRPIVFQASSMKALPTGELTAKEADKAMARLLQKNKKDEAANGGDNDEIASSDSEGDQQIRDDKRRRKGSKLGALGLAVIPLYQALHANDKSQVMELVTLASRSQADIVATVRRLELPYCLQLFHIISERLIALNQIDHPFNKWITAILQARGVEMINVEKEKLLPLKCSNVKQFIAPLQNSYEGMLDLQDRLSVLYGRMSIFNAIHPRTTVIKSVHATLRKGTVGADPAIFPNSFKEVLVQKKERKGTVAGARSSATKRYAVVSVLEGGVKRSTADIREGKRAARKAERKRRLDAGQDDDDDTNNNTIDDVFDEADEDEMMEHLDDMNLDDSDDDVVPDKKKKDKSRSIIEDDGHNDDDSAEDDSEESSAGDAEDLLDSEDELGLEEDEEDGYASGEEDDEDEEDDDSDDLAGIQLNDDEDDDDSDAEDGDDSANDVDEEIRHEFDNSRSAPRSTAEKNRNRRMRTD